MKAEIKIPEIAPNPTVWRYLVLERDNYTCQECGYQGNWNNGLHTHHLNTNLELRLVVGNGQALCNRLGNNCHRKATNKNRKIRKNYYSYKPTDSHYNPNAPEDLLTITEVAKELKLHPMTIYRKLISGKIEGIKLAGSTWRIKSEQLNQYVTRQLTPPV